MCICSIHLALAQSLHVLLLLVQRLQLLVQRLQLLYGWVDFCAGVHVFVISQRLALPRRQLELKLELRINERASAL